MEYIGLLHNTLFLEQFLNTAYRRFCYRIYWEGLAGGSGKDSIEGGSSFECRIR
jgi:hypothetical protein